MTKKKETKRQTSFVILVRTAERVDRSEGPKEFAKPWTPHDPYITAEGEKIAFCVG